MDLQKQKSTLVRAGYWIVAALAVYLAVRYLLPPALPFLWGFAIAWMLRPVVWFICRHSGMGRRGAAIVSATALYMVLGLLLWLFGSLAVVKVEDFFIRLPDLYAQRIAPFFAEAGQRLGIFARQFSRNQGAQEAGKLLAALEDVMEEMVTSASTWSIQLVGRVCKKLPGALLNLLFTLLSSVLICIDYDAVTGFVMRQIPSRHRKTVLEVRDFLAHTIWKVIKAYLILMVLTFFMLGIGLAVLKVPGFAGISAFIAVLDLLPIIGSGVVLIPWGIYALLGGETFTGVGLIVLWAVISFIKEVLEPKIVGDQIGLHPLVALISMYTGLRFAGFAGLIVAPILCLLIRHLQERGILRLFR